MTSNSGEQLICIRVGLPFRGPAWAEGLGQEELYEMPCPALRKEGPLAMMQTRMARLGSCFAEKAPEVLAESEVSQQRAPAAEEVSGVLSCIKHSRGSRD